MSEIRQEDRTRKVTPRRSREVWPTLGITRAVDPVKIDYYRFNSTEVLKPDDRRNEIPGTVLGTESMPKKHERARFSESAKY